MDTVMTTLMRFFIVFMASLVSSASYAGALTVKVYAHDATGKSIPSGIVTIKETKYGLLFVPELTGLPAGIHGFHIHQFPTCDDNGMAAGGHFDPQKTNKHLGPYNDDGHLGDLPVLFVNNDGVADLPVLAPRIKSIAQIKGRALMLHEGGDTYSDVPHLGGGGDRMRCGVIQ